MNNFVVAMASAAALIVIVAVVLATSAKTQEVFSIRECSQIMGVKEYMTSVRDVPISQNTKLVFSDGREVNTRESAWYVRRFMIDNDAHNYCLTKRVFVKK